ncbi:MAG: NADH:ubiquinone reductase (Na(+)-transporting) subunit D [Flavobacteriales bacterium]|nr:NADH:ubiquinone reductase (Na(+)-transporting) subunit D [Flavobacteriales bacterium]
MSTETTTAKVAKKEKEALFSAKRMKLITDPLNDNNPVTVQVLGICSALAITVQVKPSLFMFGGVLFVVTLGNVIVSLIRNLIPSRVRIIAQLVIVAALVIIVDLLLKAYAYDMSKQLSVFVGLIITNCIVMGRLEAFAMGNKWWPSLLDGVGNALGYGILLVLVASVREIFGSGTWLGFQVIPQAVYDMGYVNNGLMILPPMALIVVGLIIWIQRAKNTKLIEAN